MQPTDDRKHLIDLAKLMENSRDLAQKDQQELVQLLGRIDRQIAEQREHAKRWEGLDDEQVRHAYEQEKELHDIRTRIVKLVDADGEGVHTMTDEINETLERARAAQPE